MHIQMSLSLRAGAASLVLLLSLTACSHVPGVYTYESDKSGGTKAFDAKTYVDSVWASKIVPTVQAKAGDVVTVAAAIDKDPQAAGKQYGHQAGTGSPYA